MIAMEYLVGGPLEAGVAGHGGWPPGQVLSGGTRRRARSTRRTLPGSFIGTSSRPTSYRPPRARCTWATRDREAVGLDSNAETGTILGTAGYLSPEQALGKRATPASDRYSLAVVGVRTARRRPAVRAESTGPRPHATPRRHPFDPSTEGRSCPRPRPRVPERAREGTRRPLPDGGGVRRRAAGGVTRRRGTTGGCFPRSRCRRRSRRSVDLEHRDPAAQDEAVQRQDAAEVLFRCCSCCWSCSPPASRLPAATRSSGPQDAEGVEAEAGDDRADGHPARAERGATVTAPAPPPATAPAPTAGGTAGCDRPAPN